MAAVKIAIRFFVASIVVNQAVSHSIGILNAEIHFSLSDVSMSLLSTSAAIPVNTTAH